jgi:hypothetical protein
MSTTDTIDNFADGLEPNLVAVCAKLRETIDRNLPQASSKLWHAIPVWFVGENAVVGYDIRKTGIVLMFWNGQHFKTPGLEASGSFHVGQIHYTDPAQIDDALMASWLAEAGTNIWDMVGERRAFIEKRKAEKATAAVKPKAQPKAKAATKAATKAKPKAKLKAKAKSKSKSKSKTRAKAAPKAKARPKARSKARGRAMRKTAARKK